MRIGFDARMVDHPGIGRYINSLLFTMASLSNDNEFLLFGHPGKLAKFRRFANVKIVPWDLPVYPVWEQFFIAFPQKKIDLLHVPHFNIPLFFKGDMVVTIHDLIYMMVPGSGASPLSKYYAKFMIHEAIKRAAKIITVSNHTKDDIVRNFGDKFADKISVIYEAADDVFTQVEDKAKKADVRTRYRLSGKIILYVGSVKPHKNLDALFEVFALLKSWGLPHQLVISGRWEKKTGKFSEQIYQKDIRYLGEVPTEDLIVLYNIADVLVHLSLYEGFGLTILEAMQCGTPVVVSNTSSLPEVAGSAGITVDPHNVHQIADTLYNVLINPTLRSGMEEAGLRNTDNFSWEKTAYQTQQVYKEIVS